MRSLHEIAITLTAKASQFESELRRAQASIQMLDTATNHLQAHLAQATTVANASAAALEGLGATSPGGLSAQTQGVQALTGRLGQLEQELTAAQARVVHLETSLATLQARISKPVPSTTEPFIQGLARADLSAKKLEATLTTLEAQAKKAIPGTPGHLQLSQGLTQAEASLQRLSRRSSALGVMPTADPRAIQALETSLSTLRQRLLQIQPAGAAAASGFSASGAAISSLLPQVTALAAGYLSVQGAISAASFAVSAASRVETQARAWNAIAGSVKGANEELGFLRSTADKVGVNFDSLEQGYRMVAAAAKGTTLEGQATRDIFLAIARTGSVLGLSSVDVTGALRAISQMMSTGVVQADELRNELGNRIPGVMALAAKATGQTTQELRKQMEAGAVLSEEFLPKLARAMEDKFIKSMEDGQEQSRTLSQEFERAGNVLTQVAARIAADTGLIDWLKSVARWVGNIGKEANDAAERLEKLAKTRTQQQLEDIQKAGPLSPAALADAQKKLEVLERDLIERQTAFDAAMQRMQQLNENSPPWDRWMAPVWLKARTEELEAATRARDEFLQTLPSRRAAGDLGDPDLGPVISPTVLEWERQRKAIAEAEKAVIKLAQETEKYFQSLTDIEDPWERAKKAIEFYEKGLKPIQAKVPGHPLAAPPIPLAPLPAPSPTLKGTRRAPEAMQTLFARYGAQHGVDPLFLEALAQVESNFDPQAVSRAGAQGLMQFMPQTATRYGLKDPFNVEQSIEAAAKYVRDLMDMFRNNLSLVAAGYNAGEGKIQRYGGIPPYPETQQHVKKVMAFHAALQGQPMAPLPSLPMETRAPTPVPGGRDADYRTQLQARADAEQHASIISKMVLEVEAQRREELTRLVERLDTVTTAEDERARALQLTRAEELAAIGDTDGMAQALAAVEENLKLSTVSLNERERALALQRAEAQASLMVDAEVAEQLLTQAEYYDDLAAGVEAHAQRVKELTLVQRELASVNELLVRVEEQRAESIADIVAQITQGLPTLHAYEEAQRKLAGLGAGEGAMALAGTKLEEMKFKSTDAYTAMAEGAANLSSSLEDTLIASLTRGGDAWKQFGQIAVQELLRILFQATSFQKTLTELLTQAGTALLKLIPGASGAPAGAGGEIGNFNVDTDLYPRASGGPLFAGQRGLVGEAGQELLISKDRIRLVGQHGPELIRPRDHAFVIPHQQTMTLLRRGSVQPDDSPIRRLAARREAGGSMVSGGSYLAGERGVEGVISLQGMRGGNESTVSRKGPTVVHVHVHGVRDAQSFVQPHSQAQIKRAMALALDEAKRNT